MSTPCVQEALIARLEERTQNFSRRFDEVIDKINSINDKLDGVINSSIIVKEDLIKERTENKWKHRITMFIFGVIGGSGGFGISKIISSILDKQ